jgi:hypothetical protein
MQFIFLQHISLRSILILFSLLCLYLFRFPYSCYLPRPFILLDLITLTVLGQKNKLWSPPPIRCKVKVKLSLCLTKHHAMKTHWGSGGVAPRILDLGTRWRWVVSFTPRPLYPQGNSPSYPLERKLDGSQSRSGRGGEEKNSQPLPGIEP